MEVRKLSVTDKLAVWLPSLIFASAAFYLILQLRLVQRYNDFIVGSIAWSSATKVQDLVAVPSALAVLALSVLINAKMVQSRGRCIDPEAASVSGHLIWWSIVPSTLLLGLLAGHPLSRSLFFATTGMLIIFVLVYHRLVRLPVLRPQDEASLGVLSAVFFSLLPIAAAVLLARLPEGWRWLAGLQFGRGALVAALAVPVAGTACWALLAPRSFRSTLPALIALSQLGLSLFYFCLYPAGFVAADGGTYRYEVGAGLAVGLTVLAGVSVLDIFVRYRRYRYKPASLLKLISPLAVFGLLLALKFGTTQPPRISDDDYHFGEYLTGAMVFLAGGVPYVDYIPPHGFAHNDVPLLLSMLLHDGTASGLVDAIRLWGGLLVLVAFLSVYQVTRHLALAFLSILALGNLQLNFIFLIPFVCLWFSSKIILRPAVWISSWIAAAPLLVLGVPGQGLVLVFASAPIMAVMTFNLFRAPDRRRLALPPIVTAVFVAALLLLTPLRPMLFGAVGYVLVNGSINQTAYGIPWSASWQPERGFGLTFEAVRNSWIVACVLLGTTVALSWRRCTRRELLLPSAATVLFCLLMIPYGLGRIDHGALSRPGLVSMLAVSVLLPVALWPIMDARLRAPLALVIAGLGTLLSPNQISVERLRSAALALVPAGLLVDGPRSGLHGLGVTAIDRVHLSRLQALRRTLDEELAPGDPYLDLSSRGAHYFYVSRVPPIAITAPYNMPSVWQRQAAERLAARPPQLVVMEAANVNHDGGGIALRNPTLHRFILDHYVPVLRRNLVIGRLRTSRATAAHTAEIDGRIIGAGGSERGTPSAASEAVLVEDRFAIPFMAPGDLLRLPDGEGRRIVTITTDGVVTLDGLLQIQPSVPVRLVWEGELSRVAGYRSALLEFAFERRDLLALPVAWGQSESSLNRRMVHRHDIPEEPTILHDLVRAGDLLRVMGGDPFVIFDLSPLQVSGARADLLRLRFACVGQRAVPRLQLFWWGGDQAHPSETFSLRLTAQEGTLIVPMYAAHRWTSMPSITGLRIDLDNPDACEAVQFTKLSLSTRTDPD